MPISSLTVPPPVRRPHRATRPDYELLHSAIELYEAGKPEESLARTLAHLFPDLDVPDLAREEFSFPQGSSRVSARIEDGMLHVRVPVVKLGPDSLTTAALRFVLSRISASGQLYQPRLRDSAIMLEFSERVTRLHPHKVREVMRQMPFEADANDDWMVAEFRCEPLGREPIEPLTDEEFVRAEHIWRTHWDEVDELVKESQRKRSRFFLNEVTAYAVHHIGFALPLTGYWWSRISDAGDTFNDADCDPGSRESALARCCKEMKAVGADSLRDNLGHACYALSPLDTGTPEELSNQLGTGDYLDTIIRMFNAGRYIDSAVALIGTYNFLLAHYSWPEEIETQLLSGLAQVDGKPWREATATLLRHREAMVKAATEDARDDEDGDDDNGDEDDEVES